MNTYEAIAIRITNAEDKFIEYAERTAHLTHEQAVHVLRVYRKVKVIKIDAVGGQFSFTHGAFGDAEVLTNAVNYKL